MKYCERAPTNKEANNDISNEQIYEKITKNFEEIRNLSYSNFYCKFKLKKNRKNEVHKERSKKNKEIIMLPPMAPKNTTQYLTKIRENSNRETEEYKISNMLSKENIKKRLISTAENSPFSQVKSSEGNLATTEEKYSKNWKNMVIEMQSNLKNDENNYKKDAKKKRKNQKQNEKFQQKQQEKEFIFTSKYIFSVAEDSKNSNKDYEENENGYGYDNENENNNDNYNDNEIDSLSMMSGNEFFMGSTMKSIVESITKSKSKIFSKSLILDGDELTKENQPQLRDENYLNSKINMNLKLKISDFFPNVEHQNSLIDNLNFSSNSTNRYIQLDLFSNTNVDQSGNTDFNFQIQDDDFFPQEQIICMDLSETDKSTNISVLSKPLLYIHSSNDDNENEYEDEDENEEVYNNAKFRENKNSKKKKRKSVFSFG